MFDPGLVMGPCIVEMDRIVTRDVQYQLELNRCRNKNVNLQGSSAYSVGGDSGQDGQTAEISTISPCFSKSMGKIIYQLCTSTHLACSFPPVTMAALTLPSTSLPFVIKTGLSLPVLRGLKWSVHQRYILMCLQT
ncbi:hypothetical protein DPMN_030498 [Dreissena polymorpha]|uniref:Uncharacterized protein n=1 Tax=Dreissena polymorpha TaxID=45954 RepID=A0A9D4M186_DREPO|nr:hypothetical protein DPMN_030498 [Dreissena polymorpha]